MWQDPYLIDLRGISMKIEPVNAPPKKTTKYFDSIYSTIISTYEMLYSKWNDEPDKYSDINLELVELEKAIVEYINLKGFVDFRIIVEDEVTGVMKINTFHRDSTVSIPLHRYSDPETSELVLKGSPSFIKLIEILDKYDDDTNKFLSAREMITKLRNYN